MINRENLVKIGRAGGKTSNRETPDQIGRVGISANKFGLMLCWGRRGWVHNCSDTVIVPQNKDMQCKCPILVKSRSREIKLIAKNLLLKDT